VAEILVGSNVMRYLLALFLAVSAFGQATVPNWSVRTNLSVAGYNFTNYLGRINVTTLGIVGDGATDNGALLTNAVARNQPLYFPPGTYLTSLPINTTGRLNISGAGSSSSGANVSSIVFTKATSLNRSTSNMPTLNRQPIRRRLVSRSGQTAT
jgi:hypothetical protein